MFYSTKAHQNVLCWHQLQCYFVGILPSLNILVMIKLIDIVVDLLQKHTHFEYRLLLPTLLLWGALLFLTHVFSGILSSLQTIIAEQFSINIITHLANKLTQVKNLNFFENKDHTIKLNTIHNGLHIRPLNYVSNLFFNLQRIIGLISLFGILFSISIYLPFIMIFATMPCILISNHIAKNIALPQISFKTKKKACKITYTLD